MLPLLLLGCFAAPAAVAQASTLELKVSAGYWKAFLDEPGTLAVAGALRVYFYSRLSVQPEVIYTQGSDYAHLAFMPSLVVDLRGGSRHAVVPYVIAGAGVHHTRDKRINYSYNERTFAGGFGVRIRGGARWSISPEVRFGANAFPLITAGFGVSLR